MFDYSCCTFCPLDPEQCDGCQAYESERRLNRMMAGLEPEPYDPWEDEYVYG